MPNKVYTQEETSIEWTDTGGDAALDLGTTGGDADGVRAGTEYDLGAAPRADRFRWKLVIDGFDDAPVVGETVDVYLAFSEDATQATRDGDLSGTDGDSSTVVLPNLLFLGSAVVQTITAGNELIVSGEVSILAQYVTPVVHNNTADKLLSTSDAHKFILTPCPPEVQ